MRPQVASLRVTVGLLVTGAFVAGALAVWLWMQSSASWRLHQSAAYTTGILIYNAMQDGTALPDGTSLRVLPDTDQAKASAGLFRQISGAPKAARITNVPISADAQNRLSGAPLMLAILSPDITYSLADLPRREGQTAAQSLGAITRKLTSFCSDPMVLARMGERAWVEIEGARIWGCAAAPADRRLIAVLLAVVALGALATVALNLSSSFSAFADQLRNRRRVGGPASYDIAGPQELQEIVSAVNSYLEVEREQLSSRAAVLSGVSHDLGTPATRLRLRAALIPDADLRQRFETDIDSMTGIIDSVLTYTRAEMNVEAPRKLSLTSLIDAIVADYQDTGRPVKVREPQDMVVQGARSIFMSRQGSSVVTRDRDIIVTARPVSLQRAVTNLIENALKYGRRATVGLETDAQSATIVVQDEGSENAARDIEKLMAPFQRGENTATIDGHGLGLTIVATIARLHGGELTFEDTASGVSARLMIQRS